ncbi:glycosyltransferase family 4 protein [Labrys monachus]|uniref:Glycosyltransferase involved in cell wall biosynthesis n=1 Tax=Labrys monachus TaxID=217067 RepID=A0ABU0FMY3_9HYPH|nr:glycosyltransferase family 4 protein [Labrys monachus]MDQ0395960.1 glycosyltransferase involved in cell wall biosynthesis [Labrys monachus]
MPEQPAPSSAFSRTARPSTRRPKEERLAGITVLQIIPSLEAGGAERTTIDIADALTRSGARALVATEGGRLVGELQARGGLWVPFNASTKNPLRIWGNARRLERLIREERIDLVHARSRAPAWSARLATRRLGLPFVTTYHGSYAGGNSWKKRYNGVMAEGDVVIANSYFTAETIAENWPEARERVRVIHRGTDLTAFSPSAVSFERVEVLRRAWNIEPHQRIVLLPGRLTAWKGQRVLIDAAALVKQRGLEDVAFVLAGDPQGRDGYVADIDARIAERGLRGAVHRVGHCSDMPAAYLSAAAVAIPSTSPEAFGRTAVEAQAMGCPVVVSDHGATSETVLAPPEIVGNRRTGWRTAVGDPEALAEALIEALTLGASARDGLAARARAHVEAHFSLDVMCEATLDVYGELLVRSRRLGAD